MNTVGEKEIQTQGRVVTFFQDVLGYTYRGTWQERPNNSNIEKTLLTDWLKTQGHNDNIIKKTLSNLQRKAKIGVNRTLREANREVYGLLRYGVNVQPSNTEKHITVPLIDWKNPRNNDYSIAEEVTLEGENAKRPDLVLYINGIAIGVLELKRSTVSVSVSEGIRQNLTNQKDDFIGWFFTTVQLVMAGNETQGLRYTVIKTSEKYWLRWKEADAHPAAGDNLLHRELSQVCNKERILEILHDFIVYDAGTKKICRHNQFFGVKAAQTRVKSREGGIIWHTQGSGKSLTMVWLAKWILEDNAKARVLIITDRIELDDQIEMVFKGVDEDIKRTQSGAHLMQVLNNSPDRLICSLVHKFGSNDPQSPTNDSNIDDYITEIEKHIPTGFDHKQQFFIFVDECHRTQSGKLHNTMKKLLPNAMLIGFTGTPLLKNDKQRSIETFGPYIHTYKYDEAVQDNVVLDLRYEARDVDQNITSQDKIDQWFDSKTSGLTDMAKAQLKERWGTMQNLLSSRERLEQIVADIVFDMETQDRLKNGRGNTMLVADSIFSTCRFYELFQNTELKGKCAVITSYRPTTKSITAEETGEGTTDRQKEYNIYREMLAAHFNEPQNTAMHKTDQFEQEVKKKFIDEPADMKLLIVVDKLLTGFDAPPATYLYIDKNMQDHGLFQAICRVNRLHGDDKEYGYIVDYKDLFRSLEQAITDYTGEAFENYDAEDVKGLLKDRLQQAKERLAETREKIKALCEPVAPPKDTAAYIRYFCGEESGNVEQLKANEQKRIHLYKMTAAFLRAYANYHASVGGGEYLNGIHTVDSISESLRYDHTIRRGGVSPPDVLSSVEALSESRQSSVGGNSDSRPYSSTELNEIKEEVTHYENVRQEIKLASGDYVDLKVYEPDMRHLLDTYIRAEESETLSNFDNTPLVQLIVQDKDAAIEMLPPGIRNDETAIAATIENNVRQLIVDKSDINPKYYEDISILLEDLIHQRKQGSMDYRAYLANIAELSQQINEPENELYPDDISTGALRALYDNLGDIPTQHKKEIALTIDEVIRRTKKHDWRGTHAKKMDVRKAIAKVIDDQYRDDNLDLDTIFELVANQNDY